MIEIKGVSKAYGGVKALKGVDLVIKSGEIHALLGENGAGKSTLMKIISGAVSRDKGSIRVNGEDVRFKNTQEAIGKGIGIIYQEFSLVPELSVAENVFLHRLEKKKWINWASLNKQAENVIEGIGFQLNVKDRVSELSVADQQIVEIAKALTEDVKVLILDEPSAVLGPSEIHKLFSTLRGLRDKGVAVIYISHHLNELFELSDSITILKDGVSIKTVKTADTDKDELVNLMLGRSLGNMFPDRQHRKTAQSAKRFTVQGVRVNNQPYDLDFEVAYGEILGIGGLVGSGRTELIRAVFGADQHSAKVVRIGDQVLKTANPKQSVQSGLGMVPEDRKQHGGILGCSIRENISLVNYKKISDSLGFIDFKEEDKINNSLISKMKIKLFSAQAPLNSLSGGNQQKVILAKWLNTDADLLLIDEPTRGVDVGARTEIYQIINELANSGLAIVMVSSDLEELMGVSDRILIMKNGNITGEVERSDFSEEKLLRFAIGAINE